MYYYYIYIILRYDVHSRSALPHRRIGLKLWKSHDNVFKERKVLYILHARGFARAFRAAARALVTPAAASGNPMNTKHDVLAFNNAKPLRFTGATRITLDRLMKHNIQLPGYLRAYFTCTYVWYTGCGSPSVLTSALCLMRLFRVHFRAIFPKDNMSYVTQVWCLVARQTSFSIYENHPCVFQQIVNHNDSFFESFDVLTYLN